MRKRLKDLFSEEEKQDVRSIKSNHTGDCVRNYRMAPDQQYRTFDPGRRICEAEFQPVVSGYV